MQTSCKEERHSSRESLIGICKELGLPLKKTMSEPVAAAAYFVYKFHEKEKQYFNGHTLVIDYGGGTLDISLSQVEGYKIKVLECTGKGHDDQTCGKAGVAFDEAVVTGVYERITGKKISKNDPLLYKLMQEFEAKKIGNKDQIDKKLEQYKNRKSTDRKVFGFENLEFKASDLDNAFEAIIKPSLTAALTEMKTYLDQGNVVVEDRNLFRIVMVGGFSDFFLVKYAVQEFFGTKASTDKRFDSCFNLEDTALAISKGAALVANDLVEIEMTCPISIGLKTLAEDADGILNSHDEEILKKGTKLSQYSEPQYLFGGHEIDVDLKHEKLKLTIFLGDKPKRRYINLDESIEQLIPNAHVTPNQWRFGFSVNEDCLFTLHVKDKKGGHKKTPLGNLMNRIKGFIRVRE